MSEKFGENIDTSSNSTTKKTSTEFSCREKASAYVSKIEQQLNNGIITLPQYNESKKNASLLLDSQNSEIHSLENKNQSEKEFIFGACNAGKKELSTEVNNQVELQKLKELGKYFGLSESEIQNIQNSLDQYQKESGMDLGSLKISNLLSTYKNYIETNLTDLDIQSKEKIIKSIGLRLNSLNTIISDIMVSVKEESGDNNYAYELKRERWNLNQSITNSFEFIDTQLLPTASLISKVNSGEIDLYPKSLKSEEDYKEKLLLLKAFKEGKELLSSDLNDEGNFESGFLGLFDDSGNILDSQDKGNAFFQKTGVDQTTFLADLGIQQIESPSILNEKDRELEADVMIKSIAFVGTMMIPYAGSSTSIPSDFQDIFTDSDGVISTMQMYGLITDEYKMNNEWYDTALSLVGLPGSLLGVQGVSKGPKVVKVMNRLSDLGVDSAEVANRVKAYSDTFKKELFGGKDPVESDVHNIVSDKKLTPDELEARKVAAEKKSGYSPLQVIENTSWDTQNPDLPNKLLLDAGLQVLNPKQLETLEFVHTSISKGVWKNDEKGIELITKTLANAGIGKAERNLIIRSGLAGKFEYDISGYKLLEGAMNSKPFHGDVVNFLESKGPELSFDELVLGFTHRGTDNLEEFNDWLDGLDKKGVSKQIFSELQIASNKVLVRNILDNKNPTIKYEELKLFTDRGDLNQLFSGLSDGSLLKILENDVKNLNGASQSNINLSLLTPDNLERLLSVSKTTYEGNVWLGKINRILDSSTFVMLSNKQISVLEDNFGKKLSSRIYEGVIQKLNYGKIDVSAISSDRLYTLKHIFSENFVQASDEGRILILEKSDPVLFNQETLDSFFYLGIEEIQDIEALIKIRGYLEPGGKFEGVLKNYDFNIGRIISGIDKHIASLK